MPLYKFKPSDIIYNRVKTTPQVDFVIYQSKVYYKNSDQSVNNSNTTSGHINLHEINVNRESTNLVYPFLPKGSDLSSFKTTSANAFYKSSYGDEIKGSYPLLSSISREYHITGSSRPRIDALRTVLDFYRTNSPHYEYDGPLGNKSHQPLNLISIPSIFYGSSIKKGSVDLRFYVSGTLIGELKDENKNGELIQVGPTGSVGSGTCAGVVLYNEGFLILTGNWDITDGAHAADYNDDAGSLASSWLYYSVGANDGIPEDTDLDAGSRNRVSYDMSMEGINYVPTLTMFAHAKKGELNHSENPTFTQLGNYQADTGGGKLYLENSSKPIKNIVSSSYTGYEEDFERQTYISKVGIYDEDRNLIAITKLATPLKKTNKRDYTLKIKLDF
ncbi:MAG TPA: hypothetical protein EYN08_02065 [Gammaproteobacteria bacterium]|nr:hypothetical protein [Gammaproteobacteria bacterium]